ncbi:MAG TPA: hypothetical protein PKE29_18710 [Phycisphaerales bacterium]|nr:hypothetical protein [Phycisphaerales bacterium]
MIIRTAHRPLPALVACIAVSTLGLLGGCHVGYNVYPPMEGSRGFTNVNSDPFPAVMTESMRWVVLRYPPNAHAEWNQPAEGNVGITPFAVNLPAGLNPALASKIVENIGSGALPVSPETANLPTYHISRIWISGDEATVDLVRPVFGLTVNDKPLNQGLTLRLRGGMSPWHVTSHREWAFNALQPPALNYPNAPTVTHSEDSDPIAGDPAGPSQ